MASLTNAETRDVETLIHPYTNLKTHVEEGPTIFERGQGIYVYDSAGKRYIEGMAGLWCTSLGYGNEELIEAAREQLSTLSFTHIFGGKSHDPAIELAEKLKELSPAPASKVFFTCSGSEANDSQIKLVWYYNNARGKPEKKKIIARNRGYHGVTLAAASLTGLPANHASFDLPLDRILHTGCPHHYREAHSGESEEAFSQRLADELDELILSEGPDTVAAFIAEPIMGAGGVIVPPAGYFEKIQSVLEKYDIYFIADEVICGFGRTGNMFGSQTYDLRPDSISVAKAITSAYAPLGAVTVPEEMHQAMLDESDSIGTFGHGFTYSGHPLSCAVAVKTLEIYERDNMLEHVRSVAPHFQKRLMALGEHPLVGNARGEGLIGAVELVANKDTKEQFPPSAGASAYASKMCQEEGVICRNIFGDALAVCPPLIIERDGIDEIFEMMERGLDRAHEHLRNST